MRTNSVFSLLVLSLFFVGASVSARAETLVGSNVDARVLVGLNANADGIEALMPEGWASVPFPSGPLKGSNLLMVLIDGILEMDPDGKPLDPPNRRAAVLVGLGKKDDAVRLYVLRLLTTVPERNPYSVNVAAEVSRTRSLVGSADGTRKSSDEWRISSAAGEELVFRLDYVEGKRGWSMGESFPHSAADPDFSRIYRYEQMVDLVMSKAVGKPSSGDYSLTNGISDLETVLDGSEEIIAILDVPVYVRDVFLP
ncbi:MAG: hypothetical protein QNJ20_02020 [Paracoccaceae bacterium]|nr:hypothetical protein [Paracoccaceae bacterium]